MPGTTLSKLKECFNSDVYEVDNETRDCSSERSCAGSSPFPSVESVMRDIEAYFDIRGRVA